MLSFFKDEGDEGLTLKEDPKELYTHHNGCKVIKSHKITP